MFQAVVYPMKLSLEGYRFGSSKQDKLNKDQVDRWEMILFSEMHRLETSFFFASFFDYQMRQTGILSRKLAKPVYPVTN